jgi:hypothetical protein
VANETVTESGKAGGGEGEGLQLSRYDSPKALADGLTENWTDAVAALADGSLEQHVRDVLKNPQLADDIAEIAKDKSVSEDTRLFRVIMRLDLREHAEIMGYELSEGGLAELTAEVDGPFPTWSATSALRIMYTDRVLTTYAEATKTPRFRELDDRWHEEFETWAKLVGRSREAGGPDVFSLAAWRRRAKILRRLLDMKDDESIRSKARESAKKPTVAEWTSEVGSLDGAGVGSLLAVADLDEAADVYDATRRAERKAEASRRRRGVIGGIAVVVLLVGVVYGIIAFTNVSTTVGTNFDTASATPTATVATSIDPASATVVGTATLSEDSPLLKEPKADAEVVQQLKKDSRVFLISHDTNGFYLVKLADDEKVVGYVDKNVANVICPVQCGG